MLFFFAGCTKESDDITPKLIQEKLIGTWTGNGAADFAGGIQWKAVFTIESDGHYSGHITSIQKGRIYAVFDNGNDNLDSTEKKFVIKGIDAFDKANGTVKFVHASLSILTYDIDDLYFTDDYRKLYFTVSWGSKMQYSLKKVSI